MKIHNEIQLYSLKNIPCLVSPSIVMAHFNVLIDWYPDFWSPRTAFLYTPTVLFTRYFAKTTANQQSVKVILAYSIVQNEQKDAQSGH
jgi:hypothetical protein